MFVCHLLTHKNVDVGLQWCDTDTHMSRLNVRSLHSMICCNALKIWYVILWTESLNLRRLIFSTKSIR